MSSLPVPIEHEPAALTSAARARVLALAEQVADRHERVTAPSTAAAYASDLAAYQRFMVDEIGAPAFPPTGDSCALYVAAMCEADRAPSSIARFMSAVSRWFTDRGIPRGHEDRPDLTRARAILRDHEVCRAARGVTVRRARALVDDDVRAILRPLGDSALDVRDRALILLAFVGALRRGELVALNWSDVREDPDGKNRGLAVSVWRSKTHQRQEIVLTRRRRAAGCPVRALEAWRKVMADAGCDVETGPIAVRVCRYGLIGPEATGVPSVDGRLSGRAISGILKRRSEAAGIDPERISGHSLRRGLASSLHRRGVDLVAIARAGSWVPGSAVMFGYLEETDQWDDNVARVLDL